MNKTLSLLLIITTLLSIVNAKLDVSPAAAESAARPDDGPSDRVSVEHLDVAKTSEKTKQEAAPSSSFRFRSMPVETPVDKFYPPPIQQVELERPEDNSQDEMYLNPMGDKTEPGNETWLDGDSKAFMMSEMRGAAARQYMPMP